jgi:hypothetical protein
MKSGSTVMVRRSAPGDFYNINIGFRQTVSAAFSRTGRKGGWLHPKEPRASKQLTK